MDQIILFPLSQSVFMFWKFHIGCNPDLLTNEKKIFQYTKATQILNPLFSRIKINWTRIKAIVTWREGKKI